MGTETLDRSPGSSPSPGDDDDDAIDPRIRARRQLVQQDVDRSRLGKVIFVLALVAIVAGSVAALRSPLLDVDHVRVAGADRTTADAIVAASGVRDGQSMGGVALDQASRRVASLPWIARARVDRHWPGTIRISVTERRPFAAWHSGRGDWILFDRTGRALARTATVPPTLLRISGDQSVRIGGWLDARWDTVLHVGTHLPSDLAPQVRQIHRDGRGADLSLFGERTVVLGGREDISAKLEALRTLLAQPDSHCFAAINLRVASAPALTRQPGCA